MPIRLPQAFPIQTEPERILIDRFLRFGNRDSDQPEVSSGFFLERANMHEQVIAREGLSIAKFAQTHPQTSESAPTHGTLLRHPILAFHVNVKLRFLLKNFHADVLPRLNPRLSQQREILPASIPTPLPPARNPNVCHDCIRNAFYCQNPQAAVHSQNTYSSNHTAVHRTSPQRACPTSPLNRQTTRPDAQATNPNNDTPCPSAPGNNPLPADRLLRFARTTHDGNEIRSPDRSTDNRQVPSAYSASLFPSGLTADASSKMRPVPAYPINTIPTSLLPTPVDGAALFCPTSPELSHNPVSARVPGRPEIMPVVLAGVLYPTPPLSSEPTPRVDRH